jgi:TolB protein
MMRFAEPLEDLRDMSLMPTLNRFRALALFAVVLGGAPAGAAIRIEITQGVDAAQPIAVVPMGWEEEGAAPIDVAAVVAGDLARSGRFKPLAVSDMPQQPTESRELKLEDWRGAGVDYVVVGKLTRSGTGFSIRFQLFDALRGNQLIGYSIPVPRDALRRGAHRVADMIYEKLTGEPGAFSTRVAYITETREGEVRRYNLVVADADGENQRVIVQSAHPLMSPSWSPDGRRIAYVSFEAKRSEIYVQDLASGKREVVSGREGINGAPAWSPDGSKLALTLSTQEGNPDVYIMDLKSRKLTRITTSPAIDTEPSWLPDGKRLVFTSDRGGGPQIYMADSDGRDTKRLTFEGRYNARPVVAPDGKTMAMVTQEDTSYRIAVMDLASGVLRVLTDGRLDESPSFAPNSSQLLYATEFGGRGVLAAVSVDGRVRQRLALTDGDVREPAWSPYPPSRE